MKRLERCRADLEPFPREHGARVVHEQRSDGNRSEPSGQRIVRLTENGRPVRAVVRVARARVRRSAGSRERGVAPVTVITR